MQRRSRWIPPIPRAARIAIPIAGCIVVGSWLGLARSVAASPNGVSDASGSGVRTWSEAETMAVLGPGWLTRRTPLVRVYHRAHLVPTRGELIALEAECRRLAGAVGLDPVRFASLRDFPLRYYYTDDEDLLGRFLPFDASGVALPGLSLTVARRLPLGHELAHLLVHRAVVPAPPANEPLLQEGLATWLAGDGELHPRAALARGDRVLDDGRLDVAMLWSPRRFEAAPGTLQDKYAVSARFVDFLVAEKGWPAVLELYRLLCEEPAAVATRPATVGPTQVEGLWGEAWVRVRERFEDWRREHPVEDLIVAPRPERAADRGTRDEDLRVSQWRDGPDAWFVELHSTRGAPRGEVTWGETLGGHLALAAPVGPLRRYTLRFDPEGAEWVDRGTSEVLARVEWAEAVDPSSRVLRVSARELGATTLEGFAESEGFAAPRFEVPGDPE